VLLLAAVAFWPATALTSLPSAQHWDVEDTSLYLVSLVAGLGSNAEGYLRILVVPFSSRLAALTRGNSEHREASISNSEAVEKKELEPLHTTPGITPQLAAIEAKPRC
jgi:hypothetical protein